MDFMLTKQHEMARTLFKEFAEKEVKPGSGSGRDRSFPKRDR